MAEALSMPLSTPAMPARAGPARIGPNAVLQLEATLRDRFGAQPVRTVFSRAGQIHMLAEPPGEMVDERAVAALYDVLYAQLPADTANDIAAEAGRRTADYVLANRIPGPVKALLRLLPATLAAPLLLKAIARNAWTFAGSGRVSVRSGDPCVVEIADNPLTMPGCVWHVAVFEGLFRALVTPNSIVHHTVCCDSDADTCRFEIVLSGDTADRRNRKDA